MLKNILFLLSGFMLSLTGCKQQQPLDVIMVNEIEAVEWEDKKSVSIDYIHDGDTLTIPAKAEYRGGFSSGFFKHSLSVEMDDAISLIGLPADDDWIFNANYIDKTFMRHKISYDLYREMNPRNMAPESAYFNFYFNDKYEGLYVLMEKVNAGFLGLDKKDTLAMLFKDPPVFRYDRGVQQQQPDNPYEQKYPKIEKRDYSTYLDSIQTFILHAPQSDIEERLPQIIDIENIIDWHLLLLFTNNGDGILKNFYLYKTDSQAPFRIAIWDYDHSFGRDGDNEKNMMESPLDCSKSILFSRLMEWPHYTDKLTSRYRELRTSGLFSVRKVQDMIALNDNIISQDVERNFERWPINDDWYYDHNTYQQEKELIVEFAILRLEQLDKQFGFTD